MLVRGDKPVIAAPHEACSAGVKRVKGKLLNGDENWHVQNQVPEYGLPATSGAVRRPPGRSVNIIGEAIPWRVHK
jgi:hypothetical protein